MDDLDTFTLDRARELIGRAHEMTSMLDASRERSMTLTKLDEARMWLASL